MYRVVGRWEETASARCPSHEWGDGAYDRTDPGIVDRLALHPGVYTCVEHDVACAEHGRERVDHEPQ